jgi:hypothetical protein
VVGFSILAFSVFAVPSFAVLGGRAFFCKPPRNHHPTTLSNINLLVSLLSVGINFVPDSFCFAAAAIDSDADYASLKQDIAF